MAKNKMNIRRKAVKRERNKVKREITTEDGIKSFVKIFIGVIAFVIVCYLMVLGMEYLGTFEKGYTKPEKAQTTFKYDYIMASNILTQKEKEYYVLLDDYTKNIYTYTNSMVDKSNKTIYKVDMSLNENKKYNSKESNLNIKNIDDLKVNDITLIKVNNGKVVQSYVGSEKIEEILK